MTSHRLVESDLARPQANMTVNNANTPAAYRPVGAPGAALASPPRDYCALLGRVLFALGCSAIIGMAITLAVMLAQ